MSTWPKVKLGEVLRHRKEFITIDDLQEYRRPRVKLHAQGVVLRDVLTGALIKTKSQQVCRAGEFLVAEIDAKVGGFGIVPPELDGSIVSSHYFLFVIDETKLDRAFLDFFIRTPAFREQVAAQGSTNYAAIRPARVLSYEIPLPPLAEQWRVVARIKELTAQIHEARTLRQQAAEEAEALLRSIMSHDERAKPTPMRELVKLRSPDVTVQANEIYHFAGVYCFGRGVFKGARKSGMDFAYARLTRLRAGEFVYPKLMAWEGALGVVPPECDGCVVSTEFPVFEVNEDRVLPEVLDTYFRTPSVWPMIAGESTGTNVRRRRLNPQDFLNYEMPLPSRDTQLALRKVSAEVDALKRLQAETAAELDALLPALLDRAFKGELLPHETVTLSPTAVAARAMLRYGRDYAGAVLAAEITQQLHTEPTFGQTKLQKILHLTEYVAQLREIDSNYSRHAAGPYDPKLLGAIEAKMADCQWFGGQRRKKGGHEYRPLAQAGAHRSAFDQLWPQQGMIVRGLIKIMRAWKTDRCERFSTAYAAWNDLLIWKQPATDDAILHEILHRWHPNKRRIPKALWLETVEWIRAEDFAPTGWGKATASSPAAQRSLI